MFETIAVKDIIEGVDKAAGKVRVKSVLDGLINMQHHQINQDRIRNLIDQEEEEDLGEETPIRYYDGE